MHDTNCPNCGAIISGPKCEYCGTVFSNHARIDNNAGYSPESRKWVDLIRTRIEMDRLQYLYTEALRAMRRYSI